MLGGPLGSEQAMQPTLSCTPSLDSGCAVCLQWHEESSSSTDQELIDQQMTSSGSSAWRSRPTPLPPWPLCPCQGFAGDVPSFPAPQQHVGDSSLESLPRPSSKKNRKMSCWRAGNRKMSSQRLGCAVIYGSYLEGSAIQWLGFCVLLLTIQKLRQLMH